MEFGKDIQEAKRALDYFVEISKIPRGSGNEKGIADYLEKFGKEHGLYTYRDAVNNVFLRYTPENPKGTPILLQGHMDMVCVKKADSTHDFLTDPLELFLDENGWIGAKGTTLGADNGIAVAMMLAMLEAGGDREIECLFTSSEETGMDGAVGFDYTLPRAKEMMNLDSESEDTVTVSCAGGLRLHAERELALCTVSGSALKIVLDGFAGGHSGADIHLGRINATRQLAKLLDKLCDKYDCRLISLSGGEKSNAIPAYAEAVVLVGARADAELTEMFKRAKRTFTEADAHAELRLGRMEYSGTAFDMNASAQICRMLSKLKNGVIAFDDTLNLVRTSLNIGVVRIADGKFSAEISMRSMDNGDLRTLAEAVETDLTKYGVRYMEHNPYPAWEYAEQSPLREAYVSAYRDLFGKEPIVCGIHAGLECGFIHAARPDMDMISIGPNMKNIHTPDERLEPESCERFWKLLWSVIHGKN